MNSQKGQIFILAAIVLTLVMVNVLVIIGGSLIFKESATYSTVSDQAINLAEAGVDKAVASLNSTAGSYSGESETPLGPGTYEVKITSKDSGSKVVVATGYVPNKANAKVKRTVQIVVSKGIGAAFNYGIQVGDGGMNMSNNSQVIGSVYSNGDISMSNNSSITGDVFVAGGVQPMADQQSDCVYPNCVDFVFGQSSDGPLDVAQSFKPTVSQVFNKAYIKLKKIGSPSDLTVRILGDNGGVPDQNSILASGSLSSNLVTGSYSFVPVVFTLPPDLVMRTTYWIMFDTSADSKNYWSWSGDSTQSYNNGTGMYSSNWQAKNPVWKNSNLDLGFQTYMGGVASSLTGSPGVIIGGDAHANTLQNLTVNGGAYYQIMQSVTAGSLHPNSPDPSAQVMPLSDSNIQDWKDTAASFGVHTGDITNCPSTLSSGKYIGSVSLPGGCTVTLTSPIWITGDLTLSNNDVLKLDTSITSASGVVVVTGQVIINNGNKIQGSGTGGSYLILLSEYDSKDDPNHAPAINFTNNGNSGIVYSNLGLIQVTENNNLTEITGWKLNLSNNVVITYDQGLAQAFFSSGPGGSFSVVKGTYQLK